MKYINIVIIFFFISHTVSAQASKLLYMNMVVKYKPVRTILIIYSEIGLQMS